MGLVADQFGLPSGPLGMLVGRFMARSNGDFNRWAARETAARVPAAATVVDLGCGPGVGLAALLTSFPTARIVGVDPSATMCRQARRRNRQAVGQGRLTVVHGDARAVAGALPVDVVMAIHVLYFLHAPDRDLPPVTGVLRAGGTLALGYQLRGNMPAVSQRDFAAAGHRLYDSDEDVSAVLAAAGLTTDEVRVFGDSAHPGGRLLLARAGA